MLVIFKWLTYFVQIGSAAVLLMLVAGRGGDLPRISRAAWALLAACATLYALDNPLVEILNHLATRSSSWHDVAYAVYHTTYLVNTVASSAMPAILLGLFLEGRWRRVVLTGAGVLLLGLAVAWPLAVSSWDGLLGSTRVLSFLGIVFFLVFWGALFLGRLPGVDAYLAAFVAVETVFLIVTPVQEAFFQLVGEGAAGGYWDLLEGLQLLSTAAELTITLALWRALRRGAAVHSFRAAILRRV